MKRNFETGFRNFSINTSMHGFAEVYSSKNVITKIIWIILVIFSIVITIVQINNAIRQYMVQPDVVNVEPLEGSAKLIYPDLQLCYQHWLQVTDFFEANKTYGFSKQAVLYGLSYLTEIFSQTEFNITEARESFFRAMSANNFTRLSQFFKAVTMNTPETSPDGVIKESSKTMFSQIEVKTVGNVLNLPLLCYTIPGNIIVNKIQKQITEKFGWFDKSEKRRKTFEVSFRQSTGDFGSLLENNCYKYRQMELHTWRISWIQPADLLKQRLPGFSRLLYIDRFQDPIEIDGIKTELRLKVKASVYRYKNTLERPCIEGSQTTAANESCLMTCLAKYSTKNCNCIKPEYAQMLQKDDPFVMCSYKIIFAKNASNCFHIGMSTGDHSPLQGEGSFDNMEKILKICETESPTQTFTFVNGDFCCVYSDSFTVPYDNDTIDCIEACNVKGCDVWTHEVSLVATRENDHTVFSNISKGFAINLLVEYPVASEILLTKSLNIQTWENFVGNVGGLLGVWTGASILSLIQLFYLCCCAECSSGGITKTEKNVVPVTYSIGNSAANIEVKRKIESSIQKREKNVQYHT